MLLNEREINVVRHFVWVIAALLIAGNANANTPSLSKPTIETTAKHAILIDGNTGVVLLDKASKDLIYPSSMTKIMTSYAVFRSLKEGKFSLSSQFVVSENAYKKEGTRMFLDAGRIVTIEELLKGVIIQSGNDASTVLAEGICGNERAFADEMTRMAQELGATQTNFVNASGLPDSRHTTTAYDLAVISMRLIRDFPEYYSLFSEKEYEFNGINQGNRNPLLYKNIGADGIKTGYTEGGGYGMVASVVQNGRRLILVVNGHTSMNDRAREAEKLIHWGFNEFDLVTLAKVGQVVDVLDVAEGVTHSVHARVAHDVYITIPRDHKKHLKAQVRSLSPLIAPIKEGDEIGTIVIHIPGEGAKTFPLYAHESVERAGFIQRISNSLRRLILGSEQKNEPLQSSH